MADREKVIKNLQSVANICALNGDIQSMTTIGDALALLKEQTPRVMTIDEIEALPDISDVFLEEYDCIVVAVTISRQGEKWGIMNQDITFFYGIESPDYESDEYYNDDYGKWWRCWTSRPTEEQRQNTPWEPPKEEDDAEVH